MNKIYTIKEAAQILKISEFILRLRCRRGDIKAYKEGKDWRIKEEDLNSYIELRKRIQQAIIELKKTDEYKKSSKNEQLAIEIAVEHNLTPRKPPVLPVINGKLVMGYTVYDSEGYIKSVDGIPWNEYIAKVKKDSKKSKDKK